MKTKEYMDQARKLNEQIAYKRELYAVLRGKSDYLKTEDDIIEYVDLEAEIRRDQVRLARLKEDIRQIIWQVENVKYRTLLEMRYLAMWKWPDIALAMNYSPNHIFKVHRAALAVCKKILDSEKMDSE